MSGYKISLSKGNSIIVDEAGYKKILDNISSNFVVVNGEVVNPSFIISMTKVKEAEVRDYKAERESLPNYKGHVELRDGRDVYVIDNLNGPETLKLE